VGPIELRLHATRRLNGTVSSSRGPVVGSQVLVLARTPGGGGAVATSGTDGSFHVDLPQRVSRVEAIVSAPGFALRAFDASAEGEPLALQVTEEAGNLEITIPLTDDEALRENLILAVFQNGLYVPGSILGQWTADQGQSRERRGRALQVPNVAPGEYRACLVPRPMEDSLSSILISEGAACDSGLLAPGATLSLKPVLP